MGARAVYRNFAKGGGGGGVKLGYRKKGGGGQKVNVWQRKSRRVSV